MNNVATKTPGATLTSNDFNASQDELENVVNSADIALDAADTGGGGDHEMLGRSISAYAGAGWGYIDSGAVNAHVVAIASNLESVEKYYDNMIVAYIPNGTNTSTTVTVNVATLGAKNLRLIGGGLPSVGSINASKGLILKYNDSAGYFEAMSGAEQEGLVQVVHTQTGAVATGTTQIPYDDTIPQNTEGDEYLSQTITPKDTGNTLIIESKICIASNTAGTNPIIALFQDSVANSLCAMPHQIPSGNDEIELSLRFEMPAGTTSTITFKIRAGTDAAGTTTINGLVGARKLGGVLFSSLTITEIK